MKKKKGKTASTDDVKKDDEDQSNRFIDAVKELGLEDSEKPFDQAINRIKTQKEKQE